jgi:hypothetical protein
MNGFDACVASKVPVIKRKNPLDPVYNHRGRQPCIVDLHSGHCMRDKEFPPLFVDRQAVGQQSKASFKQFCSMVSLHRRKTVAVAIHRPSTRIPEFAKIL